MARGVVARSHSTKRKTKRVLAKALDAAKIRSVNTSTIKTNAARDAGQQTHTLHRFAREIVTQCDGDLDDAQLRKYVRFRAEKVLSDTPDPVAEIARLRAALAGKGDK